MAAEQQSVPSVDVCSTINIDPDIRHFVVEATPDTPCHMWCGCDVTVDDGGSLSVRVLMAELWGVNNCSTSLRLETYDIDDNATSLCSNGSHSMVLPRSGPTMKSVRIVFQRQNCTFDSRFGVDVFGANGSMTVVCTNNSDGPPEPHTKGLFGNGVGIFVPPLLGFPGKRKIESPMNGCPAGSTGAVNVCRSGYIDNNLFLKWMRLFLETVGDTKQTPHLLLLDSYESHKSLEVVVYATDNASRVLACVI
ncbi:hypothetical protein LSAT2_005894 [Lamellibrachia satsuma]|nr:hypothetical protein LSAT2_005894 [Lamellibrachia satsuma]